MTEPFESESGTELSEVERLLLVCVRADAAERPHVLDALCRAHPPLADELRLRWGLLGEIGFVDAPEAPQRIGPFRILRRLGGGGMGVVWLAEQEGLGRRVALKVLRPEFAASARARERFQREGVVLSRLEHPGICPIYGVGEADGVPYLAMRFLQGHTLAELVDAARRQEVSGSVRFAPPDGAPAPGASERARIDEVLRVFELVARAVHAAHEAGLVHRDLKPANVMITAGCEPVVLDFGLARDEAEDEGLTHTGDLLGTPAYLAPEQLQGGRRADARTDVYALGVSLYESLTLVRPFTAGSREALYRQILAGECVGVRERNRDVGRDLAVVVATAIDRSPERRYGTAAAFADDLRRVRRREPIAARPPGVASRAWRWTHRNPAAATFVGFLVAGLVLAGLALQRVRSSLGQAQALAVANRAFEVAQREPKAGLWLAVQAWQLGDREETRSQLYASLLQSHEELRLIGHEAPVNDVRFRSDGRALVSSSDDGTVRVWDLEHPSTAPLRIDLGGTPVVESHFVGPREDHLLVVPVTARAALWQLVPGPPRAVCRFGAAHPMQLGARIAPDGRTALVLAQDGPLLVDLDERRVLRTLPHRGRIAAGGFTADGRLAVTAVGYGREIAADVPFTARVWRVADGVLLREVAHAKSIMGVAFLADGSLVTASLDGTARRWDPDTGAAIGEPIEQGAPVWCCSASPAGSGILALGGAPPASLRIYRTGSDGRAPLVREQAGRGLAWCVQCTPDGVIGAFFDATARFFDLDGVERRVFRGHGDRVVTTAVAPPVPGLGRRVATGSWDGSVRLWRLDDPVLQPHGLTHDLRTDARSASGVELAPLALLRTTAADHERASTGLEPALAFYRRGAPPSLSPSGQLVAFVTKDHRVEVFDGVGRRAAGFTIEPAARQRRGAYLVGMAGEDRVLLATAHPPRVAMRDLAGAPAGIDVAVPLASLHDLAMDVAHERFAIAGDDGALLMGFDGTVLRRFEVPTAVAAAISPDGRRLVLASLAPGVDRVRMFDLARPDAPPVRLEGHDGVVSAVAFAPDGGRLLTCCFDGFVRIWNVTGELWARLGSAAAPPDAAWSRGGEAVWVAPDTGGLYRWPATTGALLELARSRSRLVDASETADCAARLAAALGDR